MKYKCNMATGRCKFKPCNHRQHHNEVDGCTRVGRCFSTGFICQCTPAPVKKWQKEEGKEEA